MESLSLREWIVEAFDYAFDLNTKDYSKYISADFKITINNELFNFAEWQQHFAHIKAMMQQLWLEYVDILVDGQKVFVNQLVHAVKLDGFKVVTKVMAVVTVVHNKIIEIDELTFMAEGMENDKNLANIH